jgi:isoleucyl-tRNA synthetase
MEWFFVVLEKGWVRMDYGKTLHLPKTEFPMRGNLPQREPDMQAWWDEIDIYEQVQKRQQGKPKFILHDGPPYANGDIHIGHALNKVLKDIIVRFKTMQGYDAPYVPGWDTHGLPIEHAIITNRKINRREIDVLAFREMCKEYALSFIEKQKEQFKRLGVRGDWKNPYITLKPEFEAEQIRVFGEMAKKGYIYKGLKPVYWSPSSETALAEAEIEYKDKKSPSIYVKFPVKDGKGVLDPGMSIVIWTTTPWTIPANLGIAVHPDLDYAIVKAVGETFVVAAGLLETVAKNVGWQDTQVIKTVKGATLERIVCRHPFYDRDSLVVLGEHVTLEAGTGAVHTAPGHGEDDFYVGQKYGLGVLCPVDDQGRFTAEAPGFEGMFYDDANKAITELLDEKGALVHLGFITHQYPHDWRSKKPVIYRATEQWFASIDGFRETMLEQIKAVKWVPAWGETRMTNMIKDRHDWCISRQRVWGVPIPIFYCKSCGEALINDATIAHIAGIFEKEGSSAWFAKSVNELMPEGTTCPSCGGADFRQETDIMDVWFDSGSSHRAVLKQRDDLSWPADLYLEGSDQYRGWFNSSLSTAVATSGQAPYKGVLSHGFTLDAEGRKMSKSLGNVVAPQNVMKQLGADILRLWVASVDYQSDVRISDGILKQISEVYRKIRNTLRFLLGNLEGFDPANDRVDHQALSDLDRYVLIKLQRVIEKTTRAYNRYEFHVVYHTVHNFCTIDLSQFYLDICKDRLYTESLHAPIRKATQTVLYEVLVALIKMIAPILPHTADEAWRYVPGVAEVSVQLTDYPTVDESRYNHTIESLWDWFMEVRDDVLKALENARAQKLIGNSLEASVHLYPSGKVYDLLKGFEELDQLFIVSSVTLHGPDEQAPEDAAAFEHAKVVVARAEGKKCERCWIIDPRVGQVAEHPTLCPDCAETVRRDFSDLAG